MSQAAVDWMAAGGQDDPGTSPTPHDDAPVSTGNPAVDWMARGGGETPKQVSVPSTTVAGAVQAAGSGATAGIADLAGLPVDTARNIIELSKVVPGYLWHETTGKDIPGFLQPNEQPDVGSSEWIKDQLRKHVGKESVDAEEDTHTNRLLHAAGEAVPGALAGGEASAPALMRAATAGVVSGTAQQEAVEHGASPEAATAINILAGHGASKVGARVIPEVHVGGTTVTPEDASTFKDDGKAASKAADPDKDANVAARARVLKAVGFDSARTSALTNDGPSGHDEYVTSRDTTTGQGQEFRRIFDHEKETMAAHADSIVQNTGGKAGVDQATREANGDTFLKPFESLADHFDAKRKAAYDAADQAAGGLPVRLKGLESEISDASNLTNSDRVGLQSGLKAYVDKLGMLGDDGKITGTAKQAETVRKYVNENWSPANSGFAGKLKSAIDDDVTHAAGSDVYKDARAAVTEQKNTLESPDGIGRLLDASGPAGINRKVPVESVMDNVAKMPVAQLKHVVSTLDNMPSELQDEAQQAKSALQAHMASRVAEAGNSNAQAWNHKAVNKYMDDNSSKLPIVFGKDNPAITDMNNLRAAGNILRVDRSYPGAAVQGRILRTKIIPGIAAAGGTYAGERIGAIVGHGPLGATAGLSAGGAIGARVSKGAGKAAAQKRMSILDKYTD